MPVTVGQRIWIAEGGDPTQMCYQNCLYDSMRQYGYVTAVSGNTITLDRPLETDFNGSTLGLWPGVTVYDGVFRQNFVVESWWKGGRVVMHHANTTTTLGVGKAWGGGVDGTMFIPTNDPGVGAKSVCQGWLSNSIYFTFQNTVWTNNIVCGISLSEYGSMINNTFENIGPNGMEIGQGTNFSLFLNNKFINAMGGAVMYFDNRNEEIGTKIIGNTFVGAPSAGISDLGGWDDIIDDNYMYGPSIGIGGSNPNWIPWHYSKGVSVTNNHIVTWGKGHNCLNVAAYPGAVAFTIKGNVCSNPNDLGILNSGNNSQWSITHDFTVEGNNLPPSVMQFTSWPFGTSGHIFFTQYPLTSNTVTPGDYSAGDIYIVSANSTTVGYAELGAVVTQSGSTGPVLRNTVTLISGSTAVSFNNVTNLHDKGWITIAGVSGVYQITHLNTVRKTAILSSKATASVSGAPVNWAIPTFAAAFPTDEYAYRSGNKVLITDHTIDLTGNATLAYPPSLVSGGALGKNWVFRNTKAMGSVVIGANTGSSIVGNGEFAQITLPSPGDFATLVWDGSNFKVVGGSPNALSTVGIGGEFTAAGDLSGSATSQKVTGIRGYSIPVPTTAGNLYWNGSALGWAAAGRSFTAAGDSSSTDSSRTVAGKQGVSKGTLKFTSVVSGGRTFTTSGCSISSTTGSATSGTFRFGCELLHSGNHDGRCNKLHGAARLDLCRTRPHYPHSPHRW